MKTIDRHDFRSSARPIPVLLALLFIGASVASAADAQRWPPLATPDASGVVRHESDLLRSIRRGDRSRTGPVVQASQLRGMSQTRRPVSSGLPTWTGSFTRGDVTYSYTMIGTDPRKGPATTTVRTLIIPLRFEYPAEAAADFGGVNVFDASTDLVDGRTAIAGILQSPIFTPHPFTVGGVYVGTTQFADAFQRANFWGDLGPGKDYHVLLAPTVAPTQTIVVPSSEWWEAYDEYADAWRPAIGDQFFVAQLFAIINALGVPSDTMPVFVTGQVVSTLGFGAHCCRGGQGGQSWMWAAYFSSSAWGGAFPDTSALGHEILEWLDHPKDTNDVAGWALGPDRYTDWCLDRILEVADPLEDNPVAGAVPLPGRGLTYHVPDAVFIDFFTHRPRSRSAGGLYSFFGNARGPSESCVGDAVYQSVVVDPPGAYYTVLNGINDDQDVVGQYWDQAQTYHAFVRRRGRFATLDVPGAVFTVPAAINRVGQIDGYYSDGAAVHGFLLSNGAYQTLDVPGAIWTAANNINSWGDVAGVYGDASGISHGFVYRNGQFTTVDVPVAVNTSVTGINDSGDLSVIASDANFLLVGSYVRTAGGFAPVRFPGDTHDTAAAAIDNQGRVAGTFATDWYGYTDGFGTQSDGTYVRLPRISINGMNNRGQMVGTRDGHGLIATLPYSASTH